MAIKDPEERKAYQAAYRLRNHDRLVANAAKYYMNNKGFILKQVQAYRKRNKRKIKKAQALYRSSNRPLMRVRAREQYKLKMSRPVMLLAGELLNDC